MHGAHAVNVLQARAQILRGIREFFWSRGFLEVETPVLLAHPSQEPELEPLRTTLHDHRGTSHDGFLRMSPEFSIKKLLAALGAVEREAVTVTTPVSLSGTVRRSDTLDVTTSRNGSRHPHHSTMVGVFEIGPVFRDAEPWGGSHNPEFTMLEWYRIGADYTALMEDCEALVLSLCHSEESATRNLTRSTNEAGEISRPATSPSWPVPGVRTRNDTKTISYRGARMNCTPPWERLTMREAWRRYAQLDLDALLTRDAMAAACAARGLTVTGGDTFDDLFFKIHLTDVEPRLGRDRPTFLLDWPTQLAALARKKPDDPHYAERVELYIGGLEVANGFSELTDAREQRVRFEGDQARRARGSPRPPT